VVAPEEDAAVCRVQMNQVVDNLWRLAPSVYIISQKNKGVFCGNLSAFQDLQKGL